MAKAIVGVSIFLGLILCGVAYPRDSKILKQYSVAWAGISMGGFGAMEIALRYPDQALSVATLCGPYNLPLLEKQIELQLQNLDTLQSDRPVEKGFNMLNDLFLALGNPILEGSSRYLAPLGLRFDFPNDPEGKYPIRRLKIDDYVSKVLLSVDQNNDGKRSPGEPIVINSQEPYQDENGNGVWDAGEAFEDVGLDGVARTGDSGESDGVFSVDADISHWGAHDPTSLLGRLPGNVVQRLPIYFDCGTEDEFQFYPHAELFYSMLKGKDPAATAWLKLASDPRDVEMPRHLFVTFKGGHVRPLLKLQKRFRTALRFVSEHLPRPIYGMQWNDKPGYQIRRSFFSQALGQWRDYLLYVPPSYDRDSQQTYPLVVFLPGYGGTLDKIQKHLSADYIDGAIGAGYLARSFVLFPDPTGTPDTPVAIGSFYIDHVSREGGKFQSAVLESAMDVIDHYRVEERPQGFSFGGSSPVYLGRPPEKSPPPVADLEQAFF